MTITANQCVADNGLINPEAFPAKSADLDTSAITGSATDLRSMGSSVTTQVGDIDTTWGGLRSHYEAPEAEQVYAVMDPAVESATDLKTTLGKVAGYLDTYAATLDGIKPRLAALEKEAADFRARVIDGVTVDASEAKDASFGENAKGLVDWVPGVDEKQVTVEWYEDTETVEENKGYLDRYAALLEEITTAVATCANDTNALVSNMCVAPVEAVPAEAFTNPQQPMPWGTARDEERNCPESVGHGAKNFGTGLVEGVGMLVVGYNPENGDWWSGEAYGQAWGGLGDLVGSTVLMASPVGWVAAGMATTGNNDNAFSDFMYDRAKTVVGGWGSLVGYDVEAAEQGRSGWHKWEEDGWATGTESVLNVGTFFIPGAGAVGGATKVGTTGAKVSRIARAAEGVADFAVPGGSWAVRGTTRMTGPLRFFDGFADGVPTALGRGASRPDAPYADLINAVDRGAPDAPTRSTPVSETIFEPETGRADISTGTTDTGDPTNGATDGPANRYDPDAPERSTVGAGQAPEKYSGTDVQEARDNAPVDEQGRAVDHRTGEPLRADGPGGERRWHMAYDPATGEWVAQNPGSGHTQPGDLPATGEPNSFGYDPAGDRMPYANHRPDYSDQQVLDVWEDAKDENGEVWVTDRDGERVQIEWEPGEPRKDVWDMGHVPDAQYRDLRHAYLNHEISLEDFIEEYRDPDNYRVEHPDRNRSHVDELSDMSVRDAPSDGGAPPQGEFAAERVTGRPTDDAIDELLSAHGMTREQFTDALLEPTPQDPAQLSPEQIALRDIRAELGAPVAGEPVQKVLAPEVYEKYMSGEYTTARGSVTTLEDGAAMGTPRELFDGLALGYEGSPFSPTDDSMKVMRFTSQSDAEISWYSSMGGTGATDGWTDPYTGNGYTKSTDPIVPESTLPADSPIDEGAEMWTVRKDGTETLEAVYTADTWVKVQ